MNALPTLSPSDSAATSKAAPADEVSADAALPPLIPLPRVTIDSLVLNCFAERDRSNARLSEFNGLLQLFLQSSTLRGRFNHFFLLMRWLGQKDDDVPLPRNETSATAVAIDSRWRRSHVLRMVVVQCPELRTECARVIGAMAAETSCVSFFADTGMPHERGFLAEAITRTTGIFIPEPRDDTDLEQHMRRLYVNARKARRFGQIPREMFHELVEAFGLPDHGNIWQPSRNHLREAFVLLSARVQGLGLGQELRDRGSAQKISQSPFFRLSRACDRLLEALDQNANVPDAINVWHKLVAACRAELSQVERKLNDTGVSVSIVYSLEVIEKCLQRMELIADILTLPDGVARSAAIQGLMARCINATFEDKSLRELCGRNLHLLSKKIVERTGHTGGHYIARNLREYWYMWAAAAGGGLLTVATATIKMDIINKNLAALPEGIFAGFNYAISFIIMLMFGLALATKQPAMTGAALGGILRDHTGADRFERIVDRFMLICRTQLAAAISNVLFVSLGCVALGTAWRAWFNEPILSPHSAEHVFETLNPLKSGTIVYAALTGVILWSSSLVGGWVENWSIYNRIPQAIADHRWSDRLGAGRMKRLAKFVDHNISSWAGSIALGFMLGLTPALGRFAGIPLDVRHVTLSSGTLALAAVSVGWEGIPQGWLLMAAAGIAVTFVLNLTVSFVLALATAIRAYELSFSEVLRLIRTAARRMGERPWEFVLPIGWPVEDLQPQME